MKVNELRVGNWIYDECNSLSVVAGFKPFEDLETCDDDDGCHVLYRFYTADDKMLWGVCKVDSNDCKPIPLTEDILLKCGFKKFSMGVNIYDTRDLISSVVYKKGCIILSIKPNKCCVGSVETDNIKYLHQLQNLYFAITGEELKVEL